jgi:HPt (histidine-containing phosphotransfer) domain-containing protein
MFSEHKDLRRLSSLGHFLKGSSAALGVTRVRATCAKIQDYGDLTDPNTREHLSADVALKMSKQLLIRVREEYGSAERWLRKYYRDIGAGNIES